MSAFDAPLSQLVAVAAVATVADAASSLRVCSKIEFPLTVDSKSEAESQRVWLHQIGNGKACSPGSACTVREEREGVYSATGILFQRDLFFDFSLSLRLMVFVSACVCVCVCCSVVSGCNLVGFPSLCSSRDLLSSP